MLSGPSTTTASTRAAAGPPIVPSISAEDESPVVLTRYASPSYFEAIGIELLYGRLFDDDDGVAARAVLERNNADERPDA